MRRKVIVNALSCVALVAFFAAIYLSYHYLTSDPPNPRPDIGKIYVHDIHGQVVYIDFEQKWMLNGLFIGAASAFIAAIITSKWKFPP